MPEFREHRSARARPATARNIAATPAFQSRSEAAPIWRCSVIAVQLRFLRTIAPVEIQVGAERRRAPEFLIVDVELVGLESGVVGEARPWHRKQGGSHAEEPAETEPRVGHLAADLVDHQPFYVAELVAVRPTHRSTLDAIARDQLVWFGHNVGHRTLPVWGDE